MPRALVLHPAAKINLTLRVGPRGADGFHDVRTVMQSIAISDTLTVTPRKGPFALETDAPGVPADRTNLVWRAAELLWRALGRTGDPRDARIELEKQIPPAAGLGGGSADAAATLVALNRVWGRARSARELLSIAAQLGADVPFFLHGGTALGVGRGDEVYPLADVARLGLVVIKPLFDIATADAYRWLDEDRARGVSGEPPRGREVEVGWAHAPVALRNDLEAPVARRHPAIAEMVAACLRAGALAAGMTGSGSAVFGVFARPAGPPAARRQMTMLARPDWRVFVTRTLSRRDAGRRLGL